MILYHASEHCLVMIERVVQAWEKRKKLPGLRRLDEGSLCVSCLGDNNALCLVVWTGVTGKSSGKSCAKNAI